MVLLYSKWKNENEPTSRPHPAWRARGNKGASLLTGTIIFARLTCFSANKQRSSQKVKIGDPRSGYRRIMPYAGQAFWSRFHKVRRDLPTWVGQLQPVCVTFPSEQPVSRAATATPNPSICPPALWTVILSSTFAYSIRRDVTEPTTGETPSYIPRATHHAPGRPRPRADCRDGQR